MGWRRWASWGSLWDGIPAGKTPACPAPWPVRYHFRFCWGSHRGVRGAHVGRVRIRGPWSQPQVGLPTLGTQRQVEILGISHGPLYPVRDRLQVSPLPRLAHSPSPSCSPSWNWDGATGVELQSGGQEALRAPILSQGCGQASFPSSDPFGMKLIFVPAAQKVVAKVIKRYLI